MLARTIADISNEWLEAWSKGEPAPVGAEVGECLLDWELPREEPELCLEVILNILSKLGGNPGDKRFSVLAAGPLEDLLAHHGSKVIDAIENYAKANPDFSLLLGGVWRSSIDASVWERVQHVAKSGW